MTTWMQGDIWIVILQVFLSKAQNNCTLCSQLYEKFQQELKKTVTFFCEDAHFKGEEFFGLFERFRVNYFKSLEEIEIMNRMEAKRAAMARAKSDADEKNKRKAAATSIKKLSKGADKEAVSDLLKNVPKRR